MESWCLFYYGVIIRVLRHNEINTSIPLFWACALGISCTCNELSACCLRRFLDFSLFHHRFRPPRYGNITDDFIGHEKEFKVAWCCQRKDNFSKSTKRENLDDD